MDKHLHIVCLDVPYPPDYGGVFDLFYKIKTLHELGVKIHLHCFEYGRGEQQELNKYCTKVDYYKRVKGLLQLPVSLPYIVSSRANNTLLKNLLKDDYPILLEGIHCTYFLYTNQLKNRKVFVRLHNVEFEYYRQLAKSENAFLKKLYFLNESRLLKKYEKKIASNQFIAVAEKDGETYKTEFGVDIKYLPVFLPFSSIQSKEGIGKYCLYHGNLGVNENEKAAIWLAENVFSKLEIPFIIVGKNPTENLKRYVHQNKNIKIIADPDEGQMQELIRNAHINILPSFNSTGVKIKLLNALFNGRHCIVNKEAVEGTGLHEACHIAATPKDYITMIENILSSSFSLQEIDKRKQLLTKQFDNNTNALQLMQWIY